MGKTWKDIQVGDFVYHVVNVPLDKDYVDETYVKIIKHQVKEIVQDDFGGRKSRCFMVTLKLSGKKMYGSCNELLILDAMKDDDYYFDDSGPYYIDENYAKMVADNRQSAHILHAKYLIDRQKKLIKKLEKKVKIVENL